MTQPFMNPIVPMYLGQVAGQMVDAQLQAVTESPELATTKIGLLLVTHGLGMTLVANGVNVETAGKFLDSILEQVKQVEGVAEDSPIHQALVKQSSIVVPEKELILPGNES